MLDTNFEQALAHRAPNRLLEDEFLAVYLEDAAAPIWPQYETLQIQIQPSLPHNPPSFMLKAFIYAAIGERTSAAALGRVCNICKY